MTTSLPPIDPAAFRSFELAGWGDDAVAARYHDWWGSLTGQAVGPLLNAAEVGPGRQVLDVACGPGYVAAAAAEREAVVTGVDFSAAMVRQAQRRYQHITFRQGDAEALDLPSERFDAVVMNFGMLHLARPDQALAEAFRVLRPGGRLAFTVWAAPPATVGFAIVLDAISAHGDANVPIPPGPPFFRFADAAESKRSLQAAGFVYAVASPLPLVWRLPTAEALCTAFEEGAVRTRGLLRAQQPETLAAIRSAVSTAVAAHKQDGGYHIPMPCVLSSAIKP